jgi:hypothetical protein
MKGALAALGLSARRTGRVALWLPVLAFVLVATRADVGDEHALAQAFVGAASNGESNTREEFTSVFTTCVLFGGAILVAYTRHLARLRTSESAGLLVAPIGRAAWTLGGFAGVLLALAGALLGACGVALVCGVSIGARHEVRGVVDVPPLALLGEREAREIVVEAHELAGATRVTLRLVALPDAGAVVFVSLTAQRLDSDGVTRIGAAERSEARVWSRTRLAVDLPSGEGAVVLRLARLGRGAGVGIDRDGIVALAPTRAPFAAELRLVACAFVALASAAALCAACVPHVSTGFAWTLAVLPFALAFALGDAPWWLPGAEYFAGARDATLGAAGRWPSIASALALVAVGLLGAARAPRVARMNDWS